MGNRASGNLCRSSLDFRLSGRPYYVEPSRMHRAAGAKTGWGAREPSGWAPVQGRGEIDLAQTCLTRGDAERMHHQVRGLLKEYQ